MVTAAPLIVVLPPLVKSVPTLPPPRVARPLGMVAVPMLPVVKAEHAAAAGRAYTAAADAQRAAAVDRADAAAAEGQQARAVDRRRGDFAAAKAQVAAARDRRRAVRSLRGCLS